MKRGPALVVVAPLFNDWECLEPLLKGISNCAGLPEDTVIVIADDGSIIEPQSEMISSWEVVYPFTILSLGVNLGHQRAIATALVYAQDRFNPDAVLILDADGEDVPSDSWTLWREHLETPNAIVVAQRASRSEGFGFRGFYAIYRRLFLLLTGYKLDFGNFALLPANAVQRLILMPELWNHFPASVMKSTHTVVRIPVARGKRFAGKSRMNFVALVNHGMAAMSAFADRVFARLLIAASSLALVALAAFIASVLFRVLISEPLPGWLALGVTIGLVAVLQLVAMLIVVSFVILSLRTQPSIPPKDFVMRYVRSTLDFPGSR